MDPLFRLRAQLISLAVILGGVLLSGVLFFLYWALGEQHEWAAILMLLSFAVLFGSLVIAAIIRLGLRYDFPRGRVLGFMMVIGWIAASLLSTTLDTLAFISTNVAQGISYLIVLGGLVVLVVPGFLLILLPWPPKLRRFRWPRDRSGR